MVDWVIWRGSLGVYSCELLDPYVLKGNGRVGGGGIPEVVVVVAVVVVVGEGCGVARTMMDVISVGCWIISIWGCKLLVAGVDVLALLLLVPMSGRWAGVGRVSRHPVESWIWTWIPPDPKSSSSSSSRSSSRSSSSSPSDSDSLS